MVMNDEELSFCFEDTLDCLQNVYHSAMQTTEETHEDAPDCVELGMECSDTPGTERSDIFMSTFYTELGKKSDLKLSKIDAHICGQIMKTAMEKISAGKGQGLASAAGTKGEITR
ncbi:uncharacterized protein LOC128246710 [Mya arenaria]|uniref:uncharacterized protein LOC128246710 n=1 Tax=Mya arenaria TaxID=6604 RepID=UPI0022DEA65C|nr:uncharacterized protein LOC128246710 [Mya arenaria]